MVELARKARGMTQTKLAEELGCSQAAISKIEQGILPVSEDMLSTLSRVLEFPLSFFQQAGSFYAPGVKYRRARASLQVGVREKIDALNNIRARTIKELLDSIEIVNQNIPNFSVGDFGSPEEVARALREYWKMPRGPVGNLTSLIESKGGIVIHADFETEALDGVFYPFPDLPPLIFLNRNMSGDRMRFTLSHELMHVVMHRYTADAETVEDETNRGGAEFMMPADDIRPHLYGLDLHKLANLKRTWRMSMASILVRAMSLETISPRQYRSLWAQMSKEGYRKREPVDIPPEQPTLRSRLVQMHLEDLQYTEEELRRALHLNPEDFQREYGARQRQARILQLNNRVD